MTKKTENNKYNQKPKLPSISIIITIIISILLIGASYFCLYYLYNHDSDTQNSNYIEQVVVIIVAFIGAGTSIVINILTIHSNNKRTYLQNEHDDILRKKLFDHEESVRQQQESFENRWNQAKIDADLIAKARIAWIENVRVATSHFIASCYSLMRVVERTYDDEMNKQHLSAKENGLLLMLYFGPDQSVEKEYNNVVTNKGKNDQIVNLINEALVLVENLYSKDLYNALKQETEDKREQLDLQYEALPIDHIEYFKPNDTNEEIPIDIPDETTPEYSKYKNEKMEFDKFKYKNSPDYLQEVLKNLTEMIRRYLKIEWDVAKQGK